MKKTIKYIIVYLTIPLIITNNLYGIFGTKAANRNRARGARRNRPQNRINVARNNPAPTGTIRRNRNNNRRPNNRNARNNRTQNRFRRRNTNGRRNNRNVGNRNRNRNRGNNRRNNPAIPNPAIPINNNQNQNQPTINNAPNAPINTHECTICLDEKPQQDCCTLSCNHTFCRDCLTEMIDLAIRERNTTELLCPNPACRNKIDEQDVRLITNNDPQRLNAFANITFQEWQRTNPNAKNCPTPNCDYVFESDENDAHTTRCPQCNNQYCSNCLHPHAEGTSCEEAERLRANPDQATDEWIAQNTKPCPRCNARVERNGGCLHVICTCGHGFCWNCLEDHHVFVCDNPARQVAGEDQVRNARENPPAHLPIERRNRPRNRIFPNFEFEEHQQRLREDRLRNRNQNAELAEHQRRIRAYREQNQNIGIEEHQRMLRAMIPNEELRNQLAQEAERQVQQERLFRVYLVYEWYRLQLVRERVVQLHRRNRDQDLLFPINFEEVDRMMRQIRNQIENQGDNQNNQQNGN